MSSPRDLLIDSAYRILLSLLKYYVAIMLVVVTSRIFSTRCAVRD